MSGCNEFDQWVERQITSMLEQIRADTGQDYQDQFIICGLPAPPSIFEMLREPLDGPQGFMVFPTEELARGWSAAHIDPVKNTVDIVTSGRILIDAPALCLESTGFAREFACGFFPIRPHVLEAWPEPEPYRPRNKRRGPPDRRRWWDKPRKI